MIVVVVRAVLLAKPRTSIRRSSWPSRTSASSGRGLWWRYRAATKRWWRRVGSSSWRRRWDRSSTPWRLRTITFAAAGDGHRRWWWQRTATNRRSGRIVVVHARGAHEVRQRKNGRIFRALRRCGRDRVDGGGTTGECACTTLRVWRDHPCAIEERFEFRDRPESSWSAAAPDEHVFTGDSAVVNGCLQIAQGGKFDLATIYGPDDPNVRTRGWCCASNLELMAARRAFDCCAALGNERVIEVVDGATALAGDFHEAPESFPCCASEGNKCAGIC